MPLRALAVGILYEVTVPAHTVAAAVSTVGNAERGMEPLYGAEIQAHRQVELISPRSRLVEKDGSNGRGLEQSV